MEYPKDELISKALAFATKAHAGVVRRWTGEPYVEHAMRVAGHLAGLGFGPEVVAAGLLHDVLEDTDTGPAELVTLFGPYVAAMVLEVTKPAMPKLPGNKDERKAAMRLHLAGSSYEGASIKLADMIDNSSNVADHDPEFATGYLAEMRRIAPLLNHGHPMLVAELADNLAK